MMSETASAGTPPTLRRRRWLRWAALVTVALMAMTLAALALVLTSLDRPWVKSRVQRLARTQAGVDIDWTSTRVQLLSGLWVERLVVLTPAPLRAETPELLRIDGLDVKWTLPSLLGGGGARVRALTAKSLTLTVVRGGDGR